VVICGASEAPVTPEVIEGFGAMSALATDERLAKLDNTDTPDHRRASRPFAENCGFVMGESTQYFILMDDELAVELGAEIYGAVTDVFVNADGFKKSISSPGAGNYITMAKCVASAKAILGEEAVRERSMIQAHGSSTPQNRVTESMIFDKVARGFGINDWPVAAVKAFVGHPLGPASGDQLSNTLGIFADGIIPGIKTAETSADDVLDERLDICYQDKKADIDVVFLNSKGFGGNNATATVIAPSVVEKMLDKRYGSETIAIYHEKREAVRAVAKSYDEEAVNGNLNVIYNFGKGIINEENLELNEEKLSVAEFQNSVNLNFENPYADMV
jgi:acetoacetyl-[acyl-carrier protein] synthase